MQNQDSRSDRNYLPPDVLDRISEAIRGVRYGSVEVVIHNGKVIQIERKEKFRFER